ncbi:MAG: phage tail protein, partial [Acinetobacter sp.]|nr:phage tail protein [Acinetobacter sp.]
MAIQFYLTDAGKAAALHAESMGLSIALSHIGVGTAKYNPQTASSSTALAAEVERYPLNGGSVEPVSRTLRFISNIEPTVTADCFEIGLFTSDGILFAVAAAEGNTPLIRLVAFIVCIATFGMKVEDINADHLVIQLDPHAPVSVALMNQHLAHSNPHPQYPLSKELANIIWHVGSWHGTDSTQYDPSIALKPLFGYDTSWMLLPHIPRGVETLNDAVGAITGMESGTVVKAFTTRIWKRLRDGTSAPAYSLTADKAVVDEGGKVKFSLVTSGLDAGTPVDWKITGIQSDDIVPGDLSGQFIVDAAGKASYTVDIAEDSKTEGNEILKFALTYIPNKQASVLILDTSKYPEGNTTYYEGTHEIVILPNQTVKFHLHGACGGGGGSIYSPGWGAAGTDGGDTSCTIDASVLTAGGGKAG